MLMQHTRRFVQLLAFAREHHLLGGMLMIATHGVSDFRQITAAGRWHDHVFSAGKFHGYRRQFAGDRFQTTGGQRWQQALI